MDKIPEIRDTDIQRHDAGCLIPPEMRYLHTAISDYYATIYSRHFIPTLASLPLTFNNSKFLGGLNTVEIDTARLRDPLVCVYL